MPDTIQAFRCRHIHTTGARCGSKSLRHQNFCFYHNTTRKPAPKPEAPPINPAKEAFDLPFPEDRASIQLAIGEVLRRIASNTIDPRRAGLLLYGLQIASGNLPREAAPSERSSRRTEPLHRWHAARQARTRHEEDQPDLVDEVVVHPTLGAIAPEAPYQAPEEYRSPLRDLLDLVEDDESEAQPAHPRPSHAPLPSQQAVGLEARTPIQPAYPPDDPNQPSTPAAAAILPTLQAAACRVPSPARRRPPIRQLYARHAANRQERTHLGQTPKAVRYNSCSDPETENHASSCTPPPVVCSSSFPHPLHPSGDKWPRRATYGVQPRCSRAHSHPCHASSCRAGDPRNPLRQLP